MYQTVSVGNTVNPSNGWSSRVSGSPPYIIVSFGERMQNGFFPFWYICAESPTPLYWWGDEEFRRMYGENSTKDLCFTYFGDVVDGKKYDLLMKYYDRRVKEQVEALLSILDWASVKVEQQSQFIQGIRVAKTVPLLGLKICLDAYSFEDFWANVDWSNPMTYFNCIKSVVGLVSGTVGAGDAYTTRKF